MVKVGDKIRILHDGASLAAVKRGDVFTVAQILSCGDIRVNSLNGDRMWRFGPEDFEVIPESPPQKITQNGYEYSLVGPVKPEWLVDGAWVVNTDNGEKRLVKEERSGVFNLKVNDLVSIRYHDGIRNQYRTHEPKDWKWGDWAMYDGKRVFVMNNADPLGYVEISGKPITYTALSGWNMVYPSELTPTF